MRIGLVMGLHGGPAGGEREAPRWGGIRERAREAERIGFDLVVLEDALLCRDEDETVGYWESSTMTAAVAASTEHIGIGHSVINAVYRSPALVAKLAETLDEISGGRYVLGIGRGNVPDLDYSVDPLERFSDQASFSGSPAQIAERLLAFADLGFGEVRVNLHHPRGELSAVLAEAIPAMDEVVTLLHRA